MFDPKTPLSILGLIFSISGIIAASNLIIERIFRFTLFSVFISFTPNFLQALFKLDPGIAWFKIRSSGDMYDLWDVSLIYLLMLSIVLIALVGFWVFLILRLLGIYDIGTFWLSSWFIVLIVTYFQSAVQQHALEIKYKHKRATTEQIEVYMKKDPIATSRRWLHHFFLNWIRSPLVTLVLLLIIGLFIVLHWPYWLLKMGLKLHFNLNNAKTRQTYYSTYAIIFGVGGLLLMFFFD
jgi:hypothetical protein